MREGAQRGVWASYQHIDKRIAVCNTHLCQWRKRAKIELEMIVEVSSNASGADAIGGIPRGRRTGNRYHIADHWSRG